MTKHTPGPWTYFKNISGMSFRIFSKATYLATVTNSELPVNEIEKNAKLISLAPEMLETIKTLLEFAPGKYSDDHRSDRDIDFARAKAFEDAEKLVYKIQGEL